jgi:hypothetical protein
MVKAAFGGLGIRLLIGQILSDLHQNLQIV